MQLIPFVAVGAAYILFDWAVNKGFVRFTGKDVNQQLDTGLAKVLYLVKPESEAPTNESE